MAEIDRCPSFEEIVEEVKRRVDNLGAQGLFEKPILDAVYESGNRIDSKTKEKRPSRLNVVNRKKGPEPYEDDWQGF